MIWAQWQVYKLVLVTTHPVRPLVWITDVVAEGNPPLEAHVQRARLTWSRSIKTKVCSRTAWPSPSPTVGTSLVHGRLQPTSPKTAPNPACGPLHTRSWGCPPCPRPGKTEHPQGPDCPLAGGEKVCTPPSPWQWCREALGARPTCSCILPAWAPPQTAWRGQFSTHPPSSEQTWKLPAAADHKKRVL